MEFDLSNPMVWLITVVFYAFSMLVLWKLNVMGSFPFVVKMIVTILAGPLIFVVINAQVNR